jgi:hypothetical protein
MHEVKCLRTGNKSEGGGKGRTGCGAHELTVDGHMLLREGDNV